MCDDDFVTIGEAVRRVLADLGRTLHGDNVVSLCAYRSARNGSHAAVPDLKLSLTAVDGMKSNVSLYAGKTGHLS